jgi:hypothetical protein
VPHQAGKKLRGRDAQDGRDSEQHINRRRLQAVFQVRDVSSVDLGFKRKLLLRDVGRFSGPAKGFA